MTKRPPTGIKKTDGSAPKRAGKKTRYPGVKRAGDGCRIEVKVTDPKTGRRLTRDRFVPDISIEDAVRIREAWKDELLSTKKAKVPPATLSDCARLWLKRCAKKGEARSTLENKADVLTTHVLPILGDHFTERLDRNDLKSWLLEVSRKRKPTGERYAKETVLCWWRRLKALIRWVVDEYELDTDPTSAIDPEAHLHRELRVGVQARRGTNALTTEELARFLPTARELYPQHYAMIVVGFFTGMRWSELSALRWDHFNHDTMEIEVFETQWRGTEREQTKSGRGRGPAFNAFMWDVMTQHRQRLVEAQAPGVETGLCFPSESGGYRHASLMTKPFARICEACGIPKKLTSKAFRRTYNDLCRRAGVEGLVLRSMIGHSDPRMSEVYASIDPSEKQAALAKVVQMVGP